MSTALAAPLSTDAFANLDVKELYNNSAVMINSVNRYLVQLTQTLGHHLDFKKKDSDDKVLFTYSIKNKTGKEKAVIQYEARAPMSQYFKKVRQPMTIGQINRVVDKINSKITDPREAKAVSKVISSLLHYFEKDYFIEAHEDDHDLVFMMESKKERQGIEIFIS